MSICHWNSEAMGYVSTGMGDQFQWTARVSDGSMARASRLKPFSALFLPFISARGGPASEGDVPDWRVQALIHLSWAKFWSKLEYIRQYILLLDWKHPFKCVLTQGTLQMHTHHTPRVKTLVKTDGCGICCFHSYKLLKTFWTHLTPHTQTEIYFSTIFTIVSLSLAFPKPQVKVSVFLLKQEWKFSSVEFTGVLSVKSINPNWLPRYLQCNLLWRWNFVYKPLYIFIAVLFSCTVCLLKLDPSQNWGNIYPEYCTKTL